MNSGMFKHSFLALFRSPALTQKLIEGVLIGFFTLYAVVILIVMGFMAPAVIAKILPGHNPTAVVAGGLCIYFFADLLMRYFFQKFPTATIKPYLLLPIPRKKIARHMMFRSLWSPFNFIIPAFLIPFILIEVLPHESAVQVGGIILLGGSLILSANFITCAVSVYSGSSKNPAILFVMLFMLLFYLEIKGFTKIHPYIFAGGIKAVSSPVLWPIIVFIPMGIMLWLYKKFITSISYHTISSSQSEGVYLPVKGLFSRFGKPGIIMDLEIRLIVRSKRARTIAVTSLLFLLFPLYMGMQMKDGNTGGMETMFILLGAFFATGGFVLNYGQLMLSWNSTHFDLLMSRGFKIRDIFLAKYYLLALSCLLFLVVTLPYGFIFSRYFSLALIVALWNASFSIFGYMLLASVNSKRIDPNAGGMFNHEGFGLMHYLIIIPLLVFPFLIFGLAALAGGVVVAIFTLGTIGLAGVIFHKKLTVWCVNVFEKNRYKISKAFRTK